MPEAPWRVSVRPTARGWQVIFFGALILLAAWLLGTTQLYQLAYALVSLFLVALVLGFVLFLGLGYVRRIPAGKRLMARRPSHVELVVSNASRVRSPGVEVVDRLPGRRFFEVPPVEGHAERVIRAPVLFAKRGLYELGPAEIGTAEPFGLLRFVRRFRAHAEVVVYPEVFDLVGFPVRGRSAETGAQDSFVRRGDEFSGLREYRHGDDWRHIHWKSVAHTGELIVKDFADDAPQRHAVILDLRAGIRVSEIEVEDAVSAAGSVLKHLAREGLPFRLMCTDRERGATAFGADEAAYWRAMNLLAAARADRDARLDHFLDEKFRKGREGLGEGVILISRSLGEELVRSVERLRAAGLSVVVVALAVHTYRGTVGARDAPGGETAFSKDIRRLEHAGAVVRIVRHPGGVAAFARGQRGAAGVVRRAE